jgi:DNA-binding beta-propeller fold protein YncE
VLQEDPLVAALLNKGLIDDAGVEAIVEHQRGPDEGQGGILFTIDQTTMSLVVGDPLGRGSEEIMLGDRTEAWHPNDFPPHSPPYIGLFTDEGSKAGDTPAGPHSGLLLMDDECFIVGDGFRHEEHLGLGQQLLFNGASHRGIGAYPYDLSLSPDFRFVLVADRGAGLLTILDSETFSVLQRHQVRAPGSNKAINTCWVGDRIYATDNQTSSLVAIDPFGATLTRQAMAVGVLGNMMPHPDGRRVFLMTLKPHFALFVLDPANPMPEKAIPVKGDPFSPGNDPTDLMAVSPDGGHLLVMTFVNEPTPYSPVINVIEVATQKNVQRYRLPSNRKPVALGFSRPNPYYYPRIDTVTAITELGLVDLETLAKVQAELNGSEGTMDLPLAMRGGNDDMLDSVAAIRQQGEQAKEAEAAAIAAGARQVERTDKVDIPAIAEAMIVDHCITHFLNETKEINLADDAMAVDRLKTAAHTCREELEWYTASRIRLSFIHGDQGLDLWVEREEVLEWLRQRERDDMLKDAKITTIPSHCPNCGKNLLGSFICRMCGFELDVPEAMKQKRRLSLASPHPAANLAEGHVLLVDADRQRIAEIDHQRQICWQIAKDVLHQEDMIQLQQPADAIRLANGNTLVVDRETHRIAEVTPRGRAFWEVPQSDEFPDVRLYHPVRATRLEGGNTLIVDRGHHRILEIDRQFAVTWQYGEREVPGVDAGHLWHPTDIQRLANGNTLITDSGNNRIVELADGQIIWQYGNAENLAHGGEGSEAGQLNRPRSAWRLDDGNTLITDTGNGRVLIVDQAGEIVWQYRTAGGEDEIRIDEPLRSFRIKPDVVMVVGKSLVIEVNERSVVTWACALGSLAMAAVAEDQEGKIGKFKLSRGNPYMKQLEERRSALAQQAAGEAGPAAVTGEGLSAAAQERMAGLAKIAAGRLNQSEEATSNLTPLALLLVYRARNLVYRVSRQKRVLWRYGNAELERPHSAQILTNSRVLVVDTNHHRVVEIDTTTDEIVWYYGEHGKSGHEPGQLANPRWAQRLANGNTVIADQSNNRAIEVDADGLLVWQWGSWETLNGPYCCQRLDDGHTLLTDWSHHVVLEVNDDGDVVWQYGETKRSGDGQGLLNYPEMATRLPNSNTLIADTRNNRVLEVHPEGNIIWSYTGEGLHKLNGPTFAQRQSDGHTVIVHGGNRQAIEVDPQGQVVWKYLLPVERDGSP